MIQYICRGGIAIDNNFLGFCDQTLQNSFLTFLLVRQWSWNHDNVSGNISAGVELIMTDNI